MWGIGLRGLGVILDGLISAFAYAVPGTENSHFSRIVPVAGTIQHATNRAAYGFQRFDSLATT
jgi:hypothetical protein